METEVGRFRGVFEDGNSWTPKLALNLFYNFLMPDVIVKGGNVRQKMAKQGIISWLTSKRNWERRVPNFDMATFDRINKDALEILLNTTLDDLNNNRYYEDQENKEKSLPFDDRTIITYDENDNKVETRFTYGMVLENRPSLQVETGKMNQFFALREEIKAAETKYKQLKERVNNEKVGKKLEKDYEKAKSTLEQLKKDYEGTRGKAYDDTITLQQVVNNDPKVERFYSAMSFDPEALTDKQKEALGFVRQITTIDEEASKQRYEELYPDDALSYEEFKSYLEQKEAEYISVFNIFFIIESKFAKISDTSVNVKIRLDDLLNTQAVEQIKETDEEGEEVVVDSIVKAEFRQVIEELSYPVEMIDETFENAGSIRKRLQQLLGNKTRDREVESDLIRLIKQIIQRWYSSNVETLLNQRAEFTIETEGFEEGSLKDRPVRISVDNLRRFVTDSDDKRLLTDESFESQTTEADTTKGKLKVKLKFNQEVFMEQAYAAEVGATADSVIASKSATDRNKVLSKGSVKINYTVNLKDKQGIIANFPKLEAQTLYKEITPVLNRYSMRTKTTVAESANKKAKSSFTRGIYNQMYEVLDTVRAIKIAEGKDIAKTILPDKLSNLIINFPLKRFYKSTSPDAEPLFTYNEFIEQLANRGEVFRKSLKDVSSLITRLVNFVEENVDLLQKFSDDVFDEDKDDFSEMTESQRQKYLQEKEAASRRTIAQEQRRQELLEERELEREQEDAGTEEGKIVDSMFEAGEEMQESEEFQDNLNLLMMLVEVLDNIDNIDNLNSSITAGISGIENIIKVFETKITSPEFAKKLNRYTELFEKISGTKMKPEALLRKVSKVDEDNIQPSVRKEIKSYFEKVKFEWNEFITSKGDKEDKGMLLRIVKELDLERGIAQDMAKDSKFNDGRLGGLRLSDKNLFLILDYVNRVAVLKGEIAWESRRVSTISYKMEGGMFPKYGGTQGETQTQRRLRGKRMTPEGMAQQTSFRANPIDKTRLQFLDEVKSNIQVLMGVVKQ